MSLSVRYAKREELGCVNELRRMVSELHAENRPDIFRPGFCEELQQHVYQVLKHRVLTCSWPVWMTRFAALRSWSISTGHDRPICTQDAFTTFRSSAWKLLFDGAE